MLIPEIAGLQRTNGDAETPLRGSASLSTIGRFSSLPGDASEGFCFLGGDLVRRLPGIIV